MTDISRISRALISVSDKSGLIEVAQALAALGIEIVSTGGTRATLTAAGIAVRDVAELTGFPEMMDGRVKTLHPKVHGGLLAIRANAEHAAALAAHGIAAIDLLIVNLYPFEETVARGADFDSCVENIDIGGPAMIRAAAKNHHDVTVVVEPQDYAPLLAELTAHSGCTTLALRQMFSRSEGDWPARLDLPVSIEELVRYWKRQVDAFFDATNGTIVVRARAFAPQDALSLAEDILASSERLVSGLSARARRDALRNAEDEVGRAEKRLKLALTRLREFRDKEGIIDPRKTADATVALAGRVRDELVRADTELSTLKHYMRDDAPSIKMLEARVQSLKAQRRAVESEVTDTEKTRSEALSRVMGSYEQLESERTFAENTYQHALQALDRSRINADRQQVYLATFVRPTLPEEALYPRRLQALGIVFLIAIVIWAIGGVAVQSIRDHLRP